MIWLATPKFPKRAQGSRWPKRLIQQFLDMHNPLPPENDQKMVAFKVDYTEFSKTKEKLTMTVSQAYGHAARSCTRFAQTVHRFWTSLHKLLPKHRYCTMVHNIFTVLHRFFTVLHKLLSLHKFCPIQCNDIIILEDNPKKLVLCMESLIF